MNDIEAGNKLQEMCNDIAEQINQGMTYQEAELDHEANGCEPDDQISAFDWLQDALDIQYIVTGSGEYLGARVLVALGGPNIWVNTQTATVSGHWYGDRCEAPFWVDELGLDDALAELWRCR